MQYKSLWKKVTAKCLNVNVNEITDMVIGGTFLTHTLNG